MKNHRLIKYFALFMLLPFWGLVAVTSGSQADYDPDYLGDYADPAIAYLQEEETLEQKITANLMVDDMAETVTFYKDVLGFELAMSEPKEPPFVFTMMQLNDAGIMFQTRASLAGELVSFKDEKIGGSFMLYIVVDDVEAMSNRIQGKAEVLKPLNETFYGMREIAIKDNNGYILVFAQPIG